jgi:NAD(P)H-hydrate epimerase
MSNIETLVNSKGLTRLMMMENAGRSVAEAVARIFGLTPDMKVGIVAGLGNNGGDGLAAARHLRALGANVYVFLAGSEEEIKTQEALVNWRILRELKLAKLYTLRKHGIEFLEKMLRRSDVIIDAILGTGLKGEVRPPLSTIIDMLNQSGKPILSVDVPSGLDSDTGEPCGIAVKATATVTLYMPKRGLVGRNPYVGLLLVGSIGLPYIKRSIYITGSFSG